MLRTDRGGGGLRSRMPSFASQRLASAPGSHCVLAGLGGLEGQDDAGCGARAKGAKGGSGLPVFLLPFSKTPSRRGFFEGFFHVLDPILRRAAENESHSTVKKGPRNAPPPFPTALSLRIEVSPRTFNPLGPSSTRTVKRRLGASKAGSPPPPSPQPSKAVAFSRPVCFVWTVSLAFLGVFMSLCFVMIRDKNVFSQSGEKIPSAVCPVRPLGIRLPGT